MDNKGDSLPTDGLHAPRLGNSGLHWGRGGLGHAGRRERYERQEYLPTLGT